MTKSILVLGGSYHFGDNAGIFQGATYVGHKLTLPVRKTWIDDKAETIAFVFESHDVETWGTWKGHQVSINGSEIGRIKDKADTTGRVELTTLEVKKEDFLKLLNQKENFTLEIELERQAANPGLADDFVLTRIATSTNLVIVLGWK